MSFEQLQIKLLSKSGELLRCVNCFAGQVTVFRAHSGTDLQPYQRALAGIPGPERFSLNLDDEAYSPAQATLIGFGESFAGSSQSVAQFLASFGIPAGAVATALMNYGLDDLDMTLCSQLTPDQERRLRLLAATCSTEKILVLNNPFENVNSQWRERIAQQLVTFARTKEQIVIVPSLSYRPECWIDNEFIVRTQVGENLQRTIGFGSDTTQMQDVVAQVRSMVQDEDKLREVLANHPEALKAMEEEKQAPPQPSSQQLTSPTYNSQSLQQSPPSQALSGAHETQPEPARVLQSPNYQSGAFHTSAYQAPSEEDLGALSGDGADLDQTLQGGEIDLTRGVPASHVFGTLPPSRTRYYLGFGILMLCVFVGGLWVASEKKSNSQVVADTSVTSPHTSSEVTKQMEESSQTTNPFTAALANSQAKPPQKTESPTKGFLSKLTQAARSQKNQSPPRSSQPAKVAFALDMYNSGIRSAIQSAFNGSGPAPKISKQRKTTKTPQRKGEDLFTLLQSTSGSGNKLPDSNRNVGQAQSQTIGAGFGFPGNTTSNEDPEERRERIRQKFLEAIERAAARRKEQGE